MPLRGMNGWDEKAENVTPQPDPETSARAVVEACADCGVCRYLMPAECLLFDDLYRLHDREENDGGPITAPELRRLVDLCTCCGLCACPDIRSGIIQAKAGFIAREGLSTGIRLMTRLEAVAATGCRFPRLVNGVLQQPGMARLIKRLGGIHPERRLPLLPDAPFPAWALREGLHRKPAAQASPKAAYFAGCSGRYLFPEVPRAVVRTLQRFGVAVYYPEQHCCGMPTFVEGDREQTLFWVRGTVDRLAQLVAEGFAVVCSCPTCGYMLKTLVRERADYAEACQAAAGGDDRYIVVPDRSVPARGGKPRGKKLLRRLYGKLLRDDGYFAAVDALQRVQVAENTFDAGEYLLDRLCEGVPAPDWKVRHDRLVYFVPCHQREQQIGRPYLELLQAIPGLSLDVIDGPYDCCGMGGNMGFKKNFHEASLRLAAPLLEKIRRLSPEGIVTDCLSCRLQLTHALPYRVYHPMELLSACC